jgi:hypothetical protein
MFDATRDTPGCKHVEQGDFSRQCRCLKADILPIWHSQIDGGKRLVNENRPDLIRVACKSHRKKADKRQEEG